MTRSPSASLLGSRMVVSVSFVFCRVGLEVMLSSVSFREGERTPDLVSKGAELVRVGLRTALPESSVDFRDVVELSVDFREDGLMGPLSSGDFREEGLRTLLPVDLRDGGLRGPSSVDLREEGLRGPPPLTAAWRGGELETLPARSAVGCREIVLRWGPSRVVSRERASLSSVFRRDRTGTAVTVVPGASLLSSVSSHMSASSPDRTPDAGA